MFLKVVCCYCIKMRLQVGKGLTVCCEYPKEMFFTAHKVKHWCILHVCSRQLSKTLRQKNKLLIMSANISFTTIMFSTLFNSYTSIYRYLKYSCQKRFQSCLLQICWMREEVNWVIREMLGYKDLHVYCSFI